MLSGDELSWQLQRLFVRTSDKWIGFRLVAKAGLGFNEHSSMHVYMYSQALAPRSEKLDDPRESFLYSTRVGSGVVSRYSAEGLVDILIRRDHNSAEHHAIVVYST